MNGPIYIILVVNVVQLLHTRWFLRLPPLLVSVLGKRADSVITSSLDLKLPFFLLLHVNLQMSTPLAIKSQPVHEPR